MQYMLSIYDMLPLIVVTGVRYDRWSAPIRFATWFKIMEMIGDSDGDIHHSLSDESLNYGIIP